MLLILLRPDHDHTTPPVVASSRPLMWAIASHIIAHHTLTMHLHIDRVFGRDAVLELKDFFRIRELD